MKKFESFKSTRWNLHGFKSACDQRNTQLKLMKTWYEWERERDGKLKDEFKVIIYSSTQTDNWLTQLLKFPQNPKTYL